MDLTLAEAWEPGSPNALNKDIRYNSRKRRLFFSGSLAYKNIKDMYMTTQELANVRGWGRVLSDRPWRRRFYVV